MGNGDLPLQIVIDTSVMIASLRSKQGASYKLMMLIDSGQFQMNLSVPLIAEYEDVSGRMLTETNLSEGDLDAILDFICSVANHRKIFFLWRPFLPDAGDDMVLELAIASGSQFIVTFNRRHFAGADQFGIKVVTPQQFLQRIGAIP